MKRLRLTPAALADLEATYEYAAEHRGRPRPSPSFLGRVTPPRLRQSARDGMPVDEIRRGY